MAVGLKITAIWVMTPCSLVEGINIWEESIASIYRLEDIA
jgi:hypothetical protein